MELKKKTQLGLLSQSTCPYRQSKDGRNDTECLIEPCQLQDPILESDIGNYANLYAHATIAVGIQLGS